MWRFWKQDVAIMAVVTAVGLLCLSPSQAAKPGGGGGGGGGGETFPYTLVDLLGALRPAGGYQSYAESLCEPDDVDGILVVGHTYVPNPHPALWDITAAGAFEMSTIDMGLPPDAREAAATDVNDAGFVVFNTEQSDEANWPAWILVPGQEIQPLPQIGDRAYAYAINNVGEIVGNTGNQGALWRLNDQNEPGQPVLLQGFLPFDINDDGLMAGSSYGQAAIGWLDANDTLTVLPIGPEYSVNFSSETAAISADGTWVAGNFRHRVDGVMRQEAFAWNIVDDFIPLGTLNGVGDSWATGVNSKGQVVGTSTTTGKSSQAAFLWQAGRMTNLNSLADTGGKTLQLGNRINEAGHIVGLLRIGKPVSESHAFLLIPMKPE